MEAQAVSRHVRIAPRKVAPGGRPRPRQGTSSEALNILEFTPKKAARVVAKTLKSVVANAENTQRVDVDRLYVKRVYRRRRADVEAVHPARAGARDADPQANQPRHRGGGRTRERLRRRLMGQKTHPKGFRLGVTRALGLEVVRAARVCTAAARGPAHAASFSSSASTTREFRRWRSSARPTRRRSTSIPLVPVSSSARRAPRSRSSRASWPSSPASETFINIHEVRRPDLDAQLVAENVALAARAPRRPSAAP